MAIRGRPIETTFTPAVAGVVKVSVKFMLWWNANVGSGPGFCSGGAFCEQTAITSYGNFVGPPRNMEQAFTAEGTFGVSAGTLVKVGLAADSGSPYSMSFRALVVTAEFTPT